MTRPRAALVTGAAYGIGAPSALALAGDGCDVAGSGLNPDDLAATVQAIAKTGARAACRLRQPRRAGQQRRRAAHPHRRRRHRGGVILVDGGLTSY